MAGCTASGESDLLHQEPLLTGIFVLLADFDSTSIMVIILVPHPAPVQGSKTRPRSIEVFELHAASQCSEQQGCFLQHLRISQSCAVCWCRRNFVYKGAVKGLLYQYMWRQRCALQCCTAKADEAVLYREPDQWIPPGVPRILLSESDFHNPERRDDGMILNTELLISCALCALLLHAAWPA